MAKRKQPKEPKEPKKAKERDLIPPSDVDPAERWPKVKRTKQTQLPGTEDKHDAVLSELAIEYVEARDYRMQLTNEETKAKQKLLGAMAERKIAVYHDPLHEIDVEVVPTEVKLKVTVHQVEKGESSPGLPKESAA